MKAQVVVDSAMRTAFALAHNKAHGSRLKSAVARRLRTNRGRIFSRGWRVIRRKRK